MSRWRIITVILLVLVPVLFLVGMGSYHLWQSGLGFALWWPMAGCVALGYILGHVWLRREKLLRPVDYTPPEIATERDRLAWAVVERHGREGASYTAAQLTNADHYLMAARQLTLDLAKHYHPDREEPLDALTIPEMLTVVQLATRDLAEMVDEYLPGGHLLTVRDFKRLRQAADWYETASNLWWIASAVFSPVTTGTRYVASKVGLSQPLKALQQNLLVWFYTAFLQRLGFYLIELYSGRLRVGAARWSEVVRGEEEGQPRVVTITLLGQVKAGKSSLVNAVLGERKAISDVLPATDAVQRYQVAPAGLPARLLLQDTPGYGREGPKADQLDQTRKAAQGSDVLLLVLHGRNPARQADLAMIEGLKKWFADKPDLKMPPIVGVLTHVDLLSPAMEWQPPYDWVKGERPKEQNIRAAVAAAQEQLSGLVQVIVPVCVAEGKVFGVEEGLLPALATELDEARVVAVLRCLRNEPDEGKVRRVFGQLVEAGKGIVGALLQRRP